MILYSVIRGIIATTTLSACKSTITTVRAHHDIVACCEYYSWSQVAVDTLYISMQWHTKQNDIDWVIRYSSEKLNSTVNSNHGIPSSYGFPVCKDQMATEKKIQRRGKVHYIALQHEKRSFIVEYILDVPISSRKQIIISLFFVSKLFCRVTIRGGMILF